MEPIRLWRWEHNQREFFAPLSDDERPYLHKAKTPLGATEYRALPRADFDALVKRDRTCPLCGDELDPDEADYDSVCPPAGAGVCSRCFARWHDAPVYEKRAAAATARANTAAALLREARPYVVNKGPFDERERSHLVRRIDAHLERKA